MPEEERLTGHDKEKQNQLCRGSVFAFLCISMAVLGALLAHYWWPLTDGETMMLGGRTTNCLEVETFDSDGFDSTHAILKSEHFHEQLCLNHSDASFHMQGNIIGGNVATIKDHRWQVSIQYRHSKSVFRHFCGGAIIAPQFILTAAHCFVAKPLNDPANWSKLWVLAGSDVTNTHPKRLHGAQARRVWSIETHPGWDSNTYDNDYALLYLNSKIKYSLSPTHPVKGSTFHVYSQVQKQSHAFTNVVNSKNKVDHPLLIVGPICMPKPEHDMNLLMAIKDRDDIKCKLAGWGVTDINDPKSSPLLMETELPWIEQSKCNTMFDKDQRTSWIDITNKNLCFGKAEGGVDGCQGDSGGSITCTIDDISLTFGVVSWGIGCGDENKPGVYGRVSLVTDWLLDQMEIVDQLSHDLTLGAHWISRAQCESGELEHCDE